MRSKDSEMFPGQWGLVGGHIDINETPKNAVIREFKEETGIEINNCKEIAQASNPEIHYFESYLDNDKILILEGKEHKNYRWMTKEEWENEDLIVSLKENLKKIYDIGYEIRKL
jgi:8-oxo-dGTP pyrophosphatase MutT (NUDIX family)